jgi:glycosyltransferase involved in cell wall biosynthesis
MKKKLFFTVTNDLVYDQRMIRICGSLSAAGYDVTLVGRRNKNAPPLGTQPFRQHRLRTWCTRGKGFYVEYNLRLFFFLLTKKMSAVCAIDLDTILPCYLVSRIRRIPRLYDAHELFCEMQEVVSRPLIYRSWKAIERLCVPKFPIGYTVNDLIADEFFRLYGVRYSVIRNVPMLRAEPSPAAVTPASFPETRNPVSPATGHLVSSGALLSSGAPFPAGAPPLPSGRFILYQGAVNEGRCFESLIPAMQTVDAPLLICGEGNFMEQARALVRQYNLEDKVLFRGMVRPEDLPPITRSAYIGVTLFDRLGASNYYSLANRFFDYIHAGIPQIAVDYPAYREINNSYRIAVLVNEPGIREISDALNMLLNNTELYHTLLANCKQARLYYNWQEEEKKLVRLYQRLFDNSFSVHNFI